MEPLPSPNGADRCAGRDVRGRFQKGNRGGPGNPMARKVGQLRAALFRCVTTGELRQVVHRLVQNASAGDVQAARLLLDRLLGPCVAVDVEERLAALERIAESRRTQNG